MSTSGVFSTLGGYHDTCGDIMSTSGDVQYVGDTMSTSGDIMSTSGMVSTLGDIMMHVGEQVGKNLSISIENPNVVNVLRCTKHLPMYS